MCLVMSRSTCCELIQKVHAMKYEHYLTKFSDQELEGPTGMAVIDSTELYVGNFDNDQIVVFDLDENRLRVFTFTN